MPAAIDRVLQAGAHRAREQVLHGLVQRTRARGRRARWSAWACGRAVTWPSSTACSSTARRAAWAPSPACSAACRPGYCIWYALVMLLGIFGLLTWQLWPYFIGMVPRSGCGGATTIRHQGTNNSMGFAERGHLAADRCSVSFCWPSAAISRLRHGARVRARRRGRVVRWSRCRSSPVRQHDGGDAVRREAAVDRALQRQLPPRRRRPVGLVRAADVIHHRDRRDRRVGGHHRARQRSTWAPS